MGFGVDVIGRFLCLRIEADVPGYVKRVADHDRFAEGQRGSGGGRGLLEIFSARIVRDRARCANDAEQGCDGDLGPHGGISFGAENLQSTPAPPEIETRGCAGSGHPAW